MIRVFRPSFNLSLRCQSIPISLLRHYSFSSDSLILKHARRFRKPQPLSLYIASSRPSRSTHSSSQHLTPSHRDDTSSKVETSQPKPYPLNDFTTPLPDEKRKERSFDAIKNLLELARPEVGRIVVAVVLLCLSSAVTMTVPYSIGKVIDIVTGSMEPPFGLSLKEMFIALVGIFITGSCANAGRVYLIRYAGEKIISRLRSKLYRSLLDKDVAFFDQNRSGDLISRLSLDTAIVGKSVTNNVSDGLRSLAMSSIGLTMMTLISPKLTLIMGMVVPPIAISAIIYGKYIKNVSRKTQDALAEITKVSEEKISNIRTVHAFARERDEADLYDLRVNDVLKIAQNEAKASALFFGWSGFSGNFAILSILVYGGNMVLENQLTLGNLTSFLLYTGWVGLSLSGLSSFFSELMKGVGASSRLFQILQSKPEIEKYEGIILERLQGHITFDQVEFSYPTRSDTPIFKNLCFDIQPGTVVAVAGQSGEGKSTIASLLLRYYDPQNGIIRIDGHDLKDLNLKWWREHVAIVSQEPTLFAGTIAENIAYGRKDSSFEAVQKAALEANCGFVDEFPEKYQTLVGERGISLSGGQKQRVAIARAILKDPCVLILDEATSALDGESEALIQEAVERISKHRTVFTIAHRLSTLKKSDIILCLDEGTVAEIGSYEELMKHENGVFRKLIQHQMHGDIDDE